METTCYSDDMTGSRPYHHGNLRQAVLNGAVAKLREKAAGELSLRELAAEIGVSHAAPRRWYPDRQALLDALAVEGFARLGARMGEAAAGAGGHEDRIRALAHAYLGFAAAEPNLVELMFAHERGPGGDAIARKAAEAFTPIQAVFAQASGAADEQDARPAALTFLATIQGLAALMSCGVVGPDEHDALVLEAVGRFAPPPGTGKGT